MSKVSDDAPVEGAAEDTEIDLSDALFSDEEMADLEASLETKASQPNAKDAVEEKEDVVAEQDGGEEPAVDDTDEGDASETEEETPQTLTATDVVGMSWDEISELESNGAEFDDGAATLYKSMKKTVNQKFEENATIRKELEDQRQMAAEDRRLAAEERQKVLDTLGKVESDKRVAAEEALMVDMTDEQRELYQVKKLLQQQQTEMQQMKQNQEQTTRNAQYLNISNRTEAVVTELAKNEPAIMRKFGKRIRKDAYQAVFEEGNSNRPVEEIAKQVFLEWQADLSPDSIGELLKDEKYAVVRTAETRKKAKKMIDKSGKKKKSTTVPASRSGEPPKKKEVKKDYGDMPISEQLAEDGVFDAIINEVESQGGLSE